MTIAPLAIAVPLLAALALVAAGRRVPRAVAGLVALAASVAVVVLCVVLLGDVWHGNQVLWMGGWHPHPGGIAVGIDLAVDPIGAGAAAFSAFVASAALVYSMRYFDPVTPLYQALVLVMLAGMVGLCLTGDLFNLFVFFELLSVPAYALTAYRVEHRRPLQGGLGFALVNSIGSFLVVSGIGLVYGRTGALNLAQIGAALAGHPADGLVVVAFTLIAAGFLIKSAVVPFHFWLADAYSSAPIPVCVLFSGVMVELGMLGLGRVWWTAFSGVPGLTSHAAGVVLLVVGLVTALVGAVMAFLQHRLKRLLAYATVGHSGMLLVGLAAVDAHGVGATAVLGLANGSLMAAMFMAVGILGRRLGSESERALHGRGRSERLACGVLAVGGLALATFPPAGFFAGKALVEEAATARGWWYVPALFVVVSALTGGAVLQAVARIYLGLGVPAPSDLLDEDDEGEGERDRDDGLRAGVLARAQLALPMVVMLLVGVVLVALPSVRHGIDHAASRFVDRPAYAAQVLHGHAPAQVESPPSSGPHASSYAYAIVSVLGALACAAAALTSGRSSRALAPVRQAGRLLQAWHTGHLGDYAVWAVVGVVVVGWALAAAVT